MWAQFRTPIDPQSKNWARSRNLDQHQACNSPPSGCRCEDPSRFRHTGVVIVAVVIVICAAGVYGKITHVPAAERAEASRAERAKEALDVKVILTPPCIFH